MGLRRELSRTVRREAASHQHRSIVPPHAVPAWGQNPPSPGTGTALDGEGTSFVVNLIVAPSNPMPQRVPPIVGAADRWGMGLRPELSRTVRREPAMSQRRSIVPPHAVPVQDRNHPNPGDGHGVGRRRDKFRRQLDCCAVQPHAPTSAADCWGSRSLGHGVRRPRTVSQRRSFLPPHAVPVRDRNHPDQDGHGVGRRRSLARAGGIDRICATLCVVVEFGCSSTIADFTAKSGTLSRQERKEQQMKVESFASLRAIFGIFSELIAQLLKVDHD
jgi:hypothetical protein